MLPSGWHHADSTAVRAYRHLPRRELLQILFVDGDRVYDYPCPAPLYDRFLRADSKGAFVNEVLKPYADATGATVESHLLA